MNGTRASCKKFFHGALGLGSMRLTTTKGYSHLELIITFALVGGVGAVQARAIRLGIEELRTISVRFRSHLETPLESATQSASCKASGHLLICVYNGSLERVFYDGP